MNFEDTLKKLEQAIERATNELLPIQDKLRAHVFAYYDNKTPENKARAIEAGKRFDDAQAKLAAACDEHRALLKGDLDHLFIKNT